MRRVCGGMQAGRMVRTGMHANMRGDKDKGENEDEANRSKYTGAEKNTECVRGDGRGIGRSDDAVWV